MEEEANTPQESSIDLDEIKQIVDLMAQNDLSFFHLEHGTMKIKLRRGSDVEAAKDLLSRMPVSAPVIAAGAAPMPAPAAAPVTPASPALVPSAGEPHGPTINSPMVGTFYRSSGPGEKPFVNVGDTVDENTTVCIIEAMKVMNEIKAEARGTIARILVDDAKPVQYGQALYELK